MGDKNDAIEKMKEINIAYSTLSDSIKREQYDASIRGQSYYKKTTNNANEKEDSATNSSNSKVKTAKSYYDYYTEYNKASQNANKEKNRNNRYSWREDYKRESYLFKPPVNFGTVISIVIAIILALLVIMLVLAN